jgi:acetamidase/formamidase
MAEHRIGRDVRTHRRWDVDVAPVLRVQPGDTVTAETDDFAGGQITRESTAEAVATLDFDQIYPLAGPVFVEGAEPGDALAVEILDFELPDWGWACIIPGFGLLPPGEFREPAIRFFDLTGGDTTELCPGVRIPIEPFCGTMGVPGAGMRNVPVPPPHAGGGMLSIGDAHAAQGDGEVAISGIECAMTTTYRVGVIKGLAIPAPQIRKPAGSLTPRVDGGGWYATSGIEPDLMTASQAAVRSMIEHLGRERGLSREDAYILCALAGDLKITEVVDAPNWMVSCFLPDAVFDS